MSHCTGIYFVDNDKYTSDIVVAQYLYEGVTQHSNISSMKCLPFRVNKMFIGRLPTLHL